MKVALKLFVITAVCGALLWGVNSLTAPIIEKNRDAAKTEAYKSLVEFDDFELVTYDSGTIQEMFTAKKDGEVVGYVFLGDKANNYGNITLMTLIDKEGNIEKVQITTMNQTAGFAEKVNNETFLANFVGPMDNVSSVDTKVGATFAATTTKEIVESATIKFRSEVLGEDVQEKQDAPKADFTKMADGTYEGEYKGFEGPIKVRVIIKDGKAIEVTVLEQKESMPQNVFEVMPGRFVEANSVDVETVAGSTVSSKALIQAVNEAMLNKVSDSTELTPVDPVDPVDPVEKEKLDVADGTYTGTAKGFVGDITVTVTVKDGFMTDIKVDHKESIPGACTTIPEAMIKENKIDVDNVAGNTVTANAIKEAVKQALEGTTSTTSKLDVADGTYSGTAKGFVGDITVTVTVKDGAMTDIKVDHKESIPGACTTIPEAMIKENKIDVDNVAGNTVTANAIKEAVKQALGL